MALSTTTYSFEDVIRAAAIVSSSVPTQIGLVVVNPDGTTISGGGGGGSTQYTDGAAAPTHYIGNALIFNNAGTNAQVTNTQGLPVTVLAGTNVIGHVIVDSGTITTVSAVTAITNALPAGTNVIGHVIADSGSTTAVTGNVTVVQATGSNLHMVVDSGTITAVTAITNALPAGTNVIGHVITDSGSVTAAAGDTASGASDAGNPVKIGVVGHTAAPTAVTDGQRVNLIGDKVGKLISVGSIRDLKVNTPTTITSSTAETTVLAAVASTFLDVYGCIVANTSATACDVSFRDSTAGTVQFDVEVPANDTRGFVLPEGGAVKQGTVNNNWTATCSASVASIKITMLAVKNI